MAKPDFRKVLRSIATAIQDANLERLLSGITVTGRSVAQRVDRAVRSTGRAKRVRLHGLRISVRELAGIVGVKTGDMLKDVTRRANQKIGRTGFKIIPSASVIRRWFAFQAGREGQVARPTSGIADSDLAAARDKIATNAREQFVQAANRRRRA